MVLVKTIVTRDNLQQAEALIKKEIDSVIDHISEQDLKVAKQAVVSSLIGMFETNRSIAACLYFLDRFKLSADYFDKRAEHIETITLDEVKKAAREVLSTSLMATIKIGRL